MEAKRGGLAAGVGGGKGISWIARFLGADEQGAFASDSFLDPLREGGAPGGQLRFTGAESREGGAKQEDPEKDFHRFVLEASLREVKLGKRGRMNLGEEPFSSGAWAS